MPLSNADLAQRISSLIDSFRVALDCIGDWAFGSASGGPANDGIYPLKNLTGGTVMVKCPARLVQDVDGTVASAAAYAADALNSKTLAKSAELAAEAAMVAASNSRNTATSERALAEIAASSAQTSAANAAVSAADALSSVDYTSEDFSASMDFDDTKIGKLLRYVGAGASTLTFRGVTPTDQRLSFVVNGVDGSAVTTGTLTLAAGAGIQLRRYAGGSVVLGNVTMPEGSWAVVFRLWSAGYLVFGGGLQP